ncbi:hypothetical protein GCM10029992_60780 [Glycomyces albus]
MVFELDAAGVDDGQGDPVDTPGLIVAAPLAQPGPRQPLEAVELLGVDRLQRAAVAGRATGLDLAEDDRVPLPGHQVDLAEAVPPVAFEDLHPVAAQMQRRVPLAEPSQAARADLPDAHLGSSRTRPEPNSSIGSR